MTWSVGTWTVLRCALGLTALVLGLGADPAAAQGRVDARYVVTLAGIPIGKGAWVIDISDDQFTAAASGNTVGLLHVFAGGRGTSASRGAIVSGAPVPESFAANITADRKTEDVRMTLGTGNVTDYVVTPSSPPDPERIPVTEAHLRGVTDPMTGSLVRVPGNGHPVQPQACQRTTHVFDGRMRYTLKFAFKRMEQVKAEKGYQGAAVACAVYFQPVAGYIPSRAAIKYLIEQREMEVWLAPVVGTRVLVPFRMSVPTPLGAGILQATQFLSVAQPPRAATAKTQ